MKSITAINPAITQIIWKNRHWKHAPNYQSAENGCITQSRHVITLPFHLKPDR